ncbi:hypothetical protein OIU85_001758 [Salix viminalis]|uniref:Uncharacterized protein n=1 Tax=Salix viminalis TaxID=40686 RepID=A0A9Q0VMG1_SALVM|nr:hypothetical protein OIU85_001758 [Salix viminalis]
MASTTVVLMILMANLLVGSAMARSPKSWPTPSPEANVPGHSPAPASVPTPPSPSKAPPEAAPTPAPTVDSPPSPPPPSSPAPANPNASDAPAEAPKSSNAFLKKVSIGGVLSVGLFAAVLVA